MVFYLGSDMLHKFLLCRFILILIYLIIFILYYIYKIIDIIYVCNFHCPYT